MLLDLKGTGRKAGVGSDVLELEVEEEGVVQIFLDVEGDLGRRNPTGLKTGHYRAVVGKDDFDGNVEERVVVGVRIVGNGSGKKGCRIKEDFDLAEVLGQRGVGAGDARELLVSREMNDRSAVPSFLADVAGDRVLRSEQAGEREGRE